MITAHIHRGRGQFKQRERIGVAGTGDDFNKDISKMYGLLELYDIEDVYFCQQSLTQRNIDSSTLIIEGKALAPGSWFDKLSSFDQVVNF